MVRGGLVAVSCEAFVVAEHELCLRMWERLCLLSAHASLVLRVVMNSISTYNLLCLVLDPYRYSECGIWVGRYTGSIFQHRRTASLYTFMMNVIRTQNTLLGFSYCSTKHTGRSRSNDFTACADHTQQSIAQQPWHCAPARFSAHAIQ